MASSLHFLLLRPPSDPNLPASPYKFRPVRCVNDRQALFNRIAGVYDNLNDLLSLGQHRVWKRMAVSWSGAKRGDNVVDLCCGSGDLAFLLSERVGSDGKVVGYDFSREQLSVAASRQQLLSKYCYKNIEWIEGDVTELPFSDCSIDAITMGYGLRNVLDRSKAMQEIFRVLKPGSKASILDFNKSDRPYITLIQMEQISKSAKEGAHLIALVVLKELQKEHESIYTKQPP